MNKPDLTAAAERILDPLTENAEVGMLIMGHAMPLARAYLSQHKEIAEQYQKTEYAKEVRRNQAEMFKDAIRKRDEQIATLTEKLRVAEEGFAEIDHLACMRRKGAICDAQAISRNALARLREQEGEKS